MDIAESDNHFLGVAVSINYRLIHSGCGETEKFMTTLLLLSARTAAMFVMSHENFPKSAGTSCRRVAAR